ncbi:hypothetical protein SGFS_005480 [Streptomyces graminofaciens]|jgi:hypothetical protein|uniref:Uncharacterized protein n=1 Tax=Streptomyces graminofaciens TaxID=68212 RepID=A0ABM7F0M1_9ACTN|nr:DUF5988 family protein [Streptomyces graminofaciens]BBC29257.1 hypothetical protein SGFS_005480 [Streptomyces graminofaciens]
MVISDGQFRRAGEGSIEVTLVGGPSGMAKKLWLPPEADGARKLKIQYLAGYEHYEQTSQSSDHSDSSRVLTWTMRTQIAE